MGRKEVKMEGKGEGYKVRKKIIKKGRKRSKESGSKMKEKKQAGKEGWNRTKEGRIKGRKRETGKLKEGKNGGK